MRLTCHNSNRLSLLILLAGVLVGSTITNALPTPESMGLDSVQLGHITERLNDLVTDGTLPGAAFTVWR